MTKSKCRARAARKQGCVSIILQKGEREIKCHLGRDRRVHVHSIAPHHTRFTGWGRWSRTWVWLTKFWEFPRLVGRSCS